MLQKLTIFLPLKIIYQYFINFYFDYLEIFHLIELLILVIISIINYRNYFYRNEIKKINCKIMHHLHEQESS